jgi:Tfp pilus assembly protein FimT
MLESFPLYTGKRLSENRSSYAINPSFKFDLQDPFRKGWGFSLLETIVVLFILTTAAAAVVPNLISWRDSMSLQSTINELLGNLHSAKALAAKHNTTVTVQFDPARRRYQLSYMDADGQVVALKQEMLPPELKIDTSHPDYTLTNHRMAFSSRGGATPGTLVVSNLAKKNVKIVISSIGRIRTEN